MWAPGHIGILGKENVDKAAKNALLLPDVSSSHPATNSDLFLFIKRFIHVSWVSHWEKQSYNILA